MVESAPLLREYTLIAYRGFESLSLRQKEERANRPFVVSGGLFLKAIAVDKKPLGFDQTRPSVRLEPSRKADESRHLTNDSAVAITLRGDRLVSANLRMSLSICCSPSGVP